MSTVITLTPIELMLKVSSASVGASESPPNTNAGPYVERVLRRTKTAKGKPWCASQFSDWGAICFGPVWPLPLTASVQEICEAAEALGIRYIPGDTEKTRPRVGDGYALWDEKLGRWAHIGLIIETFGGLDIQGRDGNTSGAGVREGWLCWEKRRTLAKVDRLIRWAEVMA